MKKLTKKRIVTPFLAISPALIFFFTIIFIVFFIGIFMALAGKPDMELSQDISLVISDVGKAVGAICGCAILRRRNKLRLRQVCHIKKFDFAVPVVLMLFLQSAAVLSNNLIGLFLSDSMTIQPNSSEFGLYGIFSAVILAPIFEEIIFRFAGTEIPRGAYSMPLICIANGVYFSVLHFYNIQGFAQVFIVGLCMAYVYCKTGNLLYTFIAHIGYNALCFIDIGSFMNSYYEKNGFVFSRWYWTVINAVIAAACLVWYFKVFRKKYTENNFKVNRETVLPNSAEQPVHSF